MLQDYRTEGTFSEGDRIDRLLSEIKSEKRTANFSSLIIEFLSLEKEIGEKEFSVNFEKYRRLLTGEMNEDGKWTHVPINMIIEMIENEFEMIFESEKHKFVVDKNILLAYLNRLVLEMITALTSRKGARGTKSPYTEVDDDGDEEI